MPVDDRAKVQQAIRVAMKQLYDLEAVKNSIDHEHTHNSPERISKAILEMYSGCWENPRDVLKTTFKDGIYDEIVYVNEIPFVSVCAHHGFFFMGKAYFGYLPDKYIVGLSKIPRLVEGFCKRPQVQEKLTPEIVDTFMEVIKPKGCGLVMEAFHLCMMVRGVETNAYTKTAALRGVFKTSESTKQEFLNGIRKTTEKIWP